MAVHSVQSTPGWRDGEDEGASRASAGTTVAPQAVRLVCAAAIALFVAFLVSRSVWSIQREFPDFEFFHKAGQHLAAHGTLDTGWERNPDGTWYQRGKLDWYLPFVHRLMVPFGMLSYKQAASIWLAINVAALIAVIRLLGRHFMGLPRQDWPVTMLLPVLFLAVPLSWEFTLNQIDVLTLLLMVSAFVHWQDGRRWVPGVWLGLAVLLKVTPGLLVVWFLLKRQWRVVLAAGFTFLLLGPVGDVLTFGSRMTVDMYQEWIHAAVHDGSHRALITDQVEMDWRNQSLSATAARWLSDTNYQTYFDNDPRWHAEFPGKPRLTLNVLDWSYQTVANVVQAIVLLILAGLIWIGRTPASRASTWQLRFEYALFMLAMLCLMPVMRRYHLIWTLPAIAVLAAGVHHARDQLGWRILALIGVLGIVFAQLALLLRYVMTKQTIEGAGVFFFAVVLMAAPLMVMISRLRRRPQALGPPDLPYDPAESTIGLPGGSEEAHPTSVEAER